MPVQTPQSSATIASATSSAWKANLQLDGGVLSIFEVVEHWIHGSRGNPQRSRLAQRLLKRSTTHRVLREKSILPSSFRATDGIAKDIVTL
jgi:hypothetical protein